jgi:hypothetical protein
MKGRGDPLQHIVQDLSTKYKVNQRQIYRDWEIRDGWLPQLLGVNDIKLFDLELMSRLEQVYQFAIKDYFGSKQENIKLGNLRLIMDILSRMKKFSVDYEVIVQIEEIKDWIHKREREESKRG